VFHGCTLVSGCLIVLGIQRVWRDENNTFHTQMSRANARSQRATVPHASNPDRPPTLTYLASIVSVRRARGSRHRHAELRDVGTPGPTPKNNRNNRSLVLVGGSVRFRPAAVGTSGRSAEEACKGIETHHVRFTSGHMLGCSRGPALYEFCRTVIMGVSG
jgi:hypothetical protein